MIDGAESTGEKELKCLDEDAGDMKKSIQSLGWVRWKTVYVRYDYLSSASYFSPYLIANLRKGCEAEGVKALLGPG